MTPFFLLASYPKSGNTWLRVFLESLDSHEQAEVNINALSIPNLSSRAMLDSLSGVSSEDLLPNELNSIRSKVVSSYARSKKEIVYAKTHELYERETSNHLAADGICGAIYLIRNPLNIVVSLAQHNNVSIDRAIEQLNDEDMQVSNEDTYPDTQFPQHYGSWSQHVANWSSTTTIPVLTVKYESLIQDAFAHFSSMVTFLGLQKKDDVIRRAIQASDFKRLQDQERKYGFRECNHGEHLFFRNGHNDAWKGALTGRQKESIISNNYPLMKKYGYL